MHPTLKFIHKSWNFPLMSLEGGQLWASGSEQLKGNSCSICVMVEIASVTNVLLKGSDPTEPTEVLRTWRKYRGNAL